MQETNVLSKRIWSQIPFQRHSLFAQGSERASRSGLVSWANTSGLAIRAEDSVCGKGYPRPKGDYVRGQGKRKKEGRKRDRGKMTWREGRGERKQKGGGLRKRKREIMRRHLYKEPTVC